MQIDSLSKFIQVLDSKGELLRIKEFVNPELEISEIADRFMKQPNGGKAILFENTGTEFPVLINHYGSDKRLFAALGIKDYNDPGQRIGKLFTSLVKTKPGLLSKLSLLTELKSASDWIPKKKAGKGKCQEVVIQNPDLDKFPVLKCWPFDGGRFFTLPLVITEDPETGIRNTGMYRMQVFDKTSTGMHWHLHKGGAAHFNKYKALGKRMPISVVLGGDPVLTYCATAPLPENIDEFMLAGFLKNESVKLVKSTTNDIYIPESADFVFEGYIDPLEDFVTEGPFGDHTGFYSLADKYPIFHITCITHRADAVFPATIVGIPPMEDFYLGKATERIFLKPIQIAIAPEIIDLRLPDYGVAHNLVLIKTKTNYQGQNLKIMNALLGAGQMMFSKVIICFNETINIHDDEQILAAITEISDLNEKIIISKGPSDVLDHSSYKYTYGGKLLIDASEVSFKKPSSFTEKIETKEKNITLFGNRIMILNHDAGFSNNYKDTAIECAKNNSNTQLRIIISVDNFNITESLELLPWYVLNNIDPAHDCIIENNILIIDASIKTKSKDGFTRQWPNIVCMDSATIEEVDKKWRTLIDLELIPSPSKKLLKLQKGNSAVCETPDL
jgi:4-hydroxy-3-polyprenylbenzoate decarboxylase